MMDTQYTGFTKSLEDFGVTAPLSQINILRRLFKGIVYSTHENNVLKNHKRFYYYTNANYNFYHNQTCFLVIICTNPGHTTMYQSNPY